MIWIEAILVPLILLRITIILITWLPGITKTECGSIWDALTNRYFYPWWHDVRHVRDARHAYSVGLFMDKRQSILYCLVIWLYVYDAYSNCTFVLTSSSGMVNETIILCNDLVLKYKDNCVYNCSTSFWLKYVLPTTELWLYNYMCLIFLSVHSFMPLHANGTNWMNVFERQLLTHSGRVLKQCYLHNNMGAEWNSWYIIVI